MASTKGAASKVSTKTDTHLVILIDESGSMGGREEAVVSGVNEFIARFSKAKGDHRATVAWFDRAAGEDRTRFKVKAKPIGKVKALRAKDYEPRGMTPLNDAIVDTVAFADGQARDGEKVFVVILTDGLENASETDAETVAKLVGKREKRGWGFLYLGANQDAQQAAARVGLRRRGQAFAFTASSSGVGNAIKTSSNLAASYSSSPTPQDYQQVAGSTADSTGGVLPEHEEVEVEDES